MGLTPYALCLSGITRTLAASLWDEYPIGQTPLELSKAMKLILQLNLPADGHESPETAGADTRPTQT
jgi:hypothetical protein